MSMRRVESPCVYRHFKGEYYATMGVSMPRSMGDIMRKYEDCDISRTLMSEYAGEQPSRAGLQHYYIDGKWCHCAFCYGGELVLYKALYDSSGVYSRDKGMFLSEVDKEKYPDADQRFRFEEVAIVV